jgi:hypothetical protein
MTRIISKGLFQLVAVLCLTIILTAVSWAGVLANHGAALSPLFTGSAPFNNGVGLSGSVDYAVFTANAFNANFGGLGYVPGGPVVYTYQVNVTGTLNASAELVGVVNPANTIGSFNIGGVAPSSASFTPNARWNFAGGIPFGSTSYGLAFSSPNLPIFGTSLTFDGGTPAGGTIVPTPGPIAIPEPASLCLFASSLAVACLSRGRR